MQDRRSRMPGGIPAVAWIPPLIARSHEMNGALQGNGRNGCPAGVIHEKADLTFHVWRLHWPAVSGINSMLRRSLFLQLILFSFLAATATARADSAVAMAAREAEDRRRSEAEIAAYRKALQENTRERAPLDWAATQNNLGEAL